MLVAGDAERPVSYTDDLPKSYCAPDQSWSSSAAAAVAFDFLSCAVDVALTSHHFESFIYMRFSRYHDLINNPKIIEFFVSI